jgi:hypothetical protein
MEFNYKNIQHVMEGGKKMVRTVKIKGERGYKSISHHHNGAKTHSKRKKLSEEEIQMIKAGKFIPGLFSKMNANNKTKKRRDK